MTVDSTRGVFDAAAAANVLADVTAGVFSVDSSAVCVLAEGAAAGAGDAMAFFVSWRAVIAVLSGVAFASGGAWASGGALTSGAASALMISAPGDG